MQPSKQERQKCHESKTVFFECLNENQEWLDGFTPTEHEQIIKLEYNSIPKSKGKCHELRKVFTGQCLPSWVEHFENLRLQEKQKEYLRERLKKEYDWSLSK